MNSVEIQVAKLDLHSGDILVARIPETIDDATREDISRTLQELVPRGVSSILAPEWLEFVIVVPETGGAA